MQSILEGGAKVRSLIHLRLSLYSFASIYPVTCTSLYENKRKQDQAAVKTTNPNECMFSLEVVMWLLTGMIPVVCFSGILGDLQIGWSAQDIKQKYCEKPVQKG